MKHSEDRSIVERLVCTVGRLLPPGIRTRIFEPACNDLVRDHLASGRGAKSGWALTFGAVKLLIGSALFGLAHFVQNRMRVKRFVLGLSVFAGIVFFFGVLVLREWIGKIYGD